MAEVGGVIPASTAIISGKDPRRGNAPFVDMMIIGLPGGAGHPHGDGWLTAAHVGNGGLIMRDSVEIDELLHPIVIWDDYILPDTEGAGRFRGAPSNYFEYGPLDTTLEAMWSADGSTNPALGARGGLAGATSKQFRRRIDGELEELSPWGHVILQADETLVSMSCGGGGYGHPYERDPELVRKDVVEGWITQKRALEVYGVVLDDGESVNHDATAKHRTHFQADTATAS